MKRSRLIVGFLALVFGVCVVWQMNDLRSKAQAAPSWPQVIGSITTSELDYEKDAKIRYRYVVDGREFDSHRLFFGVVSNGDIVFENGSMLSDAGLVARFPAGSQVKVFYDPAQPSRAILLPDARHGTGPMKAVFGYGFIAFGLVLAASAFRRPRERGSVDIGQIVFRVLLGGGMLAAGIATILYMSGIRAEARMARSWPSVTGHITLADVWGDRPEIAYRYMVDGESYLSDQLFIGVPTKRLTLDDGTELWPRRLDRRFRPGEPVDVFVDPDDPTNAILLPDAQHNTEIPIYLGYAMALIGPLVALFGKGGRSGSSKKPPARRDHRPSNGGMTRRTTCRHPNPPDRHRVPGRP